MTLDDLQLFQRLQPAIHKLAEMQLRFLDAMRVDADVVDEQDVDSD